MTRPSSLCQLASAWNGKAIPDHGTMAETKIDGWRALYFPDHTGARRLWTRNGYEMADVGHVLHKLAMMERPAGVPMFFDGEFQVGGTLASTKAYCERDWKSGIEAGAYHAFDCLPLADWRRNDSTAPLTQRKRMLADLYQASEGQGLAAGSRSTLPWKSWRTIGVLMPQTCETRLRGYGAAAVRD